MASCISVENLAIWLSFLLFLESSWCAGYFFFFVLSVTFAISLQFVTVFSSVLESSQPSSLRVLLLPYYLSSLLLLSSFSRVRLCVTPETAALQAPPSLGFSRQEHWSGLPFPSPNAWKWKVKVMSLSRVRLLATPWTASLPGSSVHGFSRQEYWSGVPLPSPTARASKYLFGRKQ